jgi:L-ribulokinase
MKIENTYVIGADFGSDSVRAVVIDSIDGSILAESICPYPRWNAGMYSDSDKSLFRQHPLDYLESIQTVISDALNRAGKTVRKHILSIAIDTTGSTPCPVDRTGTPLALLPEFEHNVNAMFHLWKDHTAVKEAVEINTTFSGWKTDYTRYQGKYSSEWYWAKVLHTGRLDEKVRNSTFSWVEHCDWMTGELTGNTDPLRMYRCACGAGHKALWHSKWGGLPAVECLDVIDPYVGHVARHYGNNVKPAGVAVGIISKKWALRLGVPEDTVIGGCSFDAHAGAVGAGIRKGTLVTNVGTSAVDMMVESAENLRGKNLAYACGMAENSILPGYMGIEAGQAAFGDVYAWLKQVLMWPYENIIAKSSLASPQQKLRLKEELERELLPELEKQAAALDIEHAPVALDWFNGRRYPYANEFVKSALGGLTLGTKTPEIYQALVLGTVFGLKRIVDSFLTEGCVIDRVIAVGGIPKKSPYIMQTMSDTLGCRICVSASSQACARGAAIFAAVAGGAYADIEEAQDIICEDYIHVYEPDAKKKHSYAAAYQKYCSLGEKAEEMAGI